MHSESIHVRNKSIVVTAKTGPRASGKSRFLQVLQLLLNAPQAVVRVDVSDIINWHVQNRTDVGVKLQKHMGLIALGDYIPDDLVVEACLEWLERHAMPKRPNLQHLLLGGFPRTEGQIEMFAAFDNFRVLHARVEKEEAYEHMLKRHQEGERRLDCTPEAFEMNWKRYEEKTLPALTKLNGRVLHLDRALPLQKRIGMCLEHLPITRAMRIRLEHRLKQPNHPARLLIGMIEQPARELVPA